MQTTRHRLTAALALAMTAAGVQAAPVSGFTDFASFRDAVAGPLVTLDFESAAPGTLIASGDSLEGIRFDYDLGGPSLKVTDAFDMPSGTNGLGTDDLDMLLDGDSLSLVLDPIGALGLLVITADTVLPGAVTLSAAGGSVGLDPGAPYSVLPDGGIAYFLGLVSNGPGFDQALLHTEGTDGGTFVFNIDDISTAAVPAPQSVLLLGLGLLGIVGQCRRGTRAGGMHHR